MKANQIVHSTHTRLMGLLLLAVAPSSLSAEQPLEISFAFSQGHPHLSWAKSSVGVYQVLARPSLAEGVWSPLGTVSTGTPRLYWADETRRQNSRFYKVATDAGNDLAARLQAVLDTVSLADRIGVSAAVYTPEHGLWLGTAGQGFRLRSAPAIKPYTRFGISSMTKTFTAALVLLLEEQGRLALDDSLEQHLTLPESLQDEVNPSITIRQLLNHTSGVGNYFSSGLGFWVELRSNPGKQWAPEDLLSLAGPPHFAPGSGWEYSDSNFILLGMIIEQASGTTVSEALRQRIQEPLGLGGTFLRRDHAVTGESAVGHFDGNEDGFYELEVSLNGEQQHNELILDNSHAWTCCGMSSTPWDLVRWARALYGGQVLSTNSLQQMMEPTPNSEEVSWLSGYPAIYGLGMRKLSTPLGDLYGHTGVGAAGNAGAMFHSLDLDVTIALLCNSAKESYASAVFAGIMDVLAETLLAEP